ncbi:MAG TPA: DJ-1/PfpI family protein [Propionibacteriaceae bacterium]|jgi:putative intracellular protease/amidase|nr:DJ-1/PfpI family protein [Propionibacteriaceae bacterium]
MQDIVLYATDTMADWEYGYLTSGISMAEEINPGRYRFRVLGDGTPEVTTKGRLRVRTDGAISDADPAAMAMLVLPGADTWAEGHDKVLNLAKRLVENGTPVAAICGATLALARAGLLDDRLHTSNAREFLGATGYAGAGFYREERVVEDREVITAPATMPVDFAAALFRRLELFPAQMVDAWYGLYTTGERQYFDQLVAGAA